MAPVSDAAGLDRGSARRRLEVRVEGVVQGVGFRPHVYRLATEAGLAGHVLNDERGVLIEVEGPRPRSTGSSPASATRRRRWRGSSASASGRSSPPGERRLRDRAEPGGGEARGAGLGGHGDLRRLPRRAPRPRRPAPSLPVHELHELRAAVHDRRRRPLRPAGDDDGRRSRCASAAGPSTRIPPTAASTPSPTPARTAVRGPCCSTPDAGGGRRPGAGDAVEAAARALLDGRIVAVKGLGGYHLACRADDEARVSRAARPQASRGQAVRRDGARPRGGARELVELTPRRSAADRAASGRS